jgi:DNA-binding transcriptional ArsR family regulator
MSFVLRQRVLEPSDRRSMDRNTSKAAYVVSRFGRIGYPVTPNRFGVDRSVCPARVANWCYPHSMTTRPFIAEIAALIGDPARANMLLALMAGRALTAGELAYAARVAPQTASAHLGKLVGARLLALEKQGRHRYFRLASPEVAELLEGLMAVAVDGAPRYRPPSRSDEALRQARTCYDHLAGRLGVALADALLSRGHIVLDDDGGQVTADGTRFLGEFGLNLISTASQRRRFCRPCLDWSERRRHLGGARRGGSGCTLLRTGLDRPRKRQPRCSDHLLRPPRFF